VATQTAWGFFKVSIRGMTPIAGFFNLGMLLDFLSMDLYPLIWMVLPLQFTGSFAGKSKAR